MRQQIPPLGYPRSTSGLIVFSGYFPFQVFRSVEAAAAAVVVFVRIVCHYVVALPF